MNQPEAGIMRVITAWKAVERSAVDGKIDAEST